MKSAEWGRFAQGYACMLLPKSQKSIALSNLAARRDAFASVLSGGEQQCWRSGRGLLSAPKLMS